jgi:hypothetical protein
MFTIPRIRGRKACSRNPDLLSKVPFRELYGGDREMLHCSTQSKTIVLCPEEKIKDLLSSCRKHDVDKFTAMF